MRTLFLLAAFLSSSLLFVIEPLAARMILPIFGGSPQVWNTSLVFFQGTLLLGYLYAHLVATYLKGWVQKAVHCGVVAVAVVALPITTQSHWFQGVREAAQGNTPPSTLVLWALAGLVGLPFFALSGNSSLLQRWYSTTSNRDAKEPYFLYAAGNVGSMLALLAYPTLIEPALKLGEQSKYWAFAYMVLIFCIGGCALVSRPGGYGVSESADVEDVADVPVTRADRLRWVSLSAVPSSLLLGVTTFLTSNIAPIPLLWVIPLALYLLTFILVFARKPHTPSKVLGRIYPLILTPLVLTIVLESDKPMLPLAVLHLVVFFVATWMCHSRLSESRPSAKHLTEFYFYLSLGGVIGGVFNALVAPVVFDTLAEYPAALVAAALLMPRKDGAKGSKWDGLYPAAIAGVMIGLVLVAKLLGMEASPLRTFLTIGFPAILCFLAVDYPTRFGLSLAAGFIVAAKMHVASDGNVPYTARSFFGVHRIVLAEHGAQHKLIHGNTIHGIQDSRYPTKALTYYYSNGPIGQVMQQMPKDRVALVGLGVGSLAAYGRAGQHMTYFEIDPVVKKVASDTRWFTFLHDSKAQVNVVLGDARLTLGKESEHYGLIVLDAFSSDAIPIHLLTVEAIQSYLDHLEPGGMLAFHISNRYLDLLPVLATASDRLGLKLKYQEDGASADEVKEGKQASNWVIVSRKSADFGPLLKSAVWGDFDGTLLKQPWTDDYCNVIGAFKPGALGPGGAD